MYGLFPLSFCPLRPFHTGPYVSPPSLSCSPSLAWMPVCHPCGSFGRRLFWSWPSLPLRAERELLTSELIDGAVGSSLTALVFFFLSIVILSASLLWDLFPFLFSFLSKHLCQPVCRFFNFFLSLRPLSQVECNLQQIWWSPKIREHDLVLWLRWVWAPVFCYFNLLLLKSTLWLFFLCIHQQNLSSIAVDLASLACQIVARCCVAGLW